MNIRRQIGIGIA